MQHTRPEISKPAAATGMSRKELCVDLRSSPVNSNAMSRQVTMVITPAARKLM
jgi:hypothetical protein